MVSPAQRVQLVLRGVRSVHEDIDNGAPAGIRPHEVHIDWTNTKKPILIKLTEDGARGIRSSSKSAAA